MFRHRSLISALIAAGAVACVSASGDRSDAPSAEQATAETRDLQMLQAPAPETTPAVSDLEAGRQETVHRAHPAHAERAGVATAPAPEPDLTSIISEASPSVAEPTVATTLVEAPAPAAAVAEEPAPTIERSPPMATWMGGSAEPVAGGGFDSGLRGAVGGHGPVIIIRGGRGGVHDDCDLDRPRVRLPGGSGIAINQRGAFPIAGSMRRGIR
ncbi:MAG: hypothetical protein AB7R55_18380 [Gemmatimonadales bacterium]